MGKWVRLSAEGAIGNARTRRDDAGEYEIDDGYNVIELTKPETLAFARQLPEVKALVEDVQLLQSALLTEGYGWQNWARRLRKRLALFEEASDG